MNLADVVCRNAGARPNDPAYCCGSRTISWLELHRRTDALAAWLIERTEVGDRVAIFADNCHRYFETHFACAKAGLIAVPINHRLTPVEVAAILDDVGAVGLVVDSADLVRHLGTVERLPRVLVAFDERVDGPRFDDIADASAPAPQYRRHEINVIGYTSGTTGRARGAVVRHEASTLMAFWFATLFGLRADSVFLACMPAYVYRGGAGGMASAVVGACTVVQSFDAAPVLDAIEAHGVSHVIFAPAMVDRLLADPSLESRNLASLSSIWIGGAPSSEESLERLGAVVGDVLGSVYGMTEVTGIASMRWHLNEDKATGRLRSVGRPAPLIDLRMLTDEGIEAEVGQPGELVVRSDAMMSHYWGETPETSLPGGWFRTGDVALRDSDGYLFLVDRRADIVNSGGINVYTLEVEQALREHLGLDECAVVGSPHPEWGETVCVFVDASQPTITLDVIRARLDGVLGRFKLPTRLERVDVLPRNAMGKVDKKALRALVWESGRAIAG